MPSRPRLHLVAATALVVMSLSACNDDETVAQPAERSESTLTPSTSAPADEPTRRGTRAPSSGDGGSGADVAVLDAGATPRQLLLLDVDEGQVETTRMDLTVGTRIPGAGSMDLPMSMTIATTVDEVTEDRIEVSFEYDDISARLPESLGAAAQQQMDDTLDAVKGISGSSTVTPSGEVLSTDLAVADDAPPMVASLLDQLTSQSSQIAVPFPSEAVGEGARWRVVTTLELAGVSTRQTATYTLDTLEGDSYAISVHVVQDVDGSTSGADLTGHTVLDGSYDGTLHTFAATAGAMSGDGSATVQASGQRVRTTTSLELQISTQVR